MGFKPRSKPRHHYYAFCETITASGSTPWHIRELSDKGLKFGGGADTPSLCNRVVAWDLEVAITEHHLTHACPTCVAAYPGVPQRSNDPVRHQPQYRFDCDHCKFNWCCGPLCVCGLPRSAYPDPPPARAREVRENLSAWRASRGLADDPGEPL